MKETSKAPPIRAVGLIAGPLLGAIVYLLLRATSGEGDAALTEPGCAVAAVGVLMAVWWLTEAIPIPVTGLVPVALLPLVTGGEVGIRAATSPYGHDLIFLYLGGFMLALAMEACRLHRRLALRTILLVGTRPRRAVLGFMIASALLSMGISNTATVVMMLPIALSVIELVREQLQGEQADPLQQGEFPFAICLLLGTAYAASIGGIATLIGTPPNGLLMGFVRDTYEQSISFTAWLPVGLSITVVLLPLTWILLTRFVFPIHIREIPGGRRLIREVLAKQGPMSPAERRVLTVFALTAAAWIGRPLLAGMTVGDLRPLAGLSDAGIAICAAVLLFILPGGEGRQLLDWQTARRLPWGILLLFGGGLSLASAVTATGVDRYLGQRVSGLSAFPVPVLVVGVTVLVVLLTEMTSNTATTATFLPVIGAVAAGLGIEPLLLLIPMTLAASCAFMMPVATPPNAIVFGSGEITIRQMCKAGIWLNLFSVAWIVVVTYLVAVPVFGL